MPPSAASASTASKRRRNFAAAARRRELGVDVGVPGDVDRGDDEVAELVGDPVAVARGDRLAQLGELLVDLRQRTADVRPVEADLGSLAPRGAGRRPARGASGATPSNTDVRPFSSRLISSQLARTVPVSSAVTSPNTCGWRRTSLSWIPAVTSAIVKRPACSAIVAWNSIW